MACGSSGLDVTQEPLPVTQRHNLTHPLVFSLNMVHGAPVRRQLVCRLERGTTARGSGCGIIVGTTELSLHVQDDKRCRAGIFAFAALQASEFSPNLAQQGCDISEDCRIGNSHRHLLSVTGFGEPRNEFLSTVRFFAIIVSTSVLRLSHPARPWGSALVAERLGWRGAVGCGEARH